MNLPFSASLPWAWCRVGIAISTNQIDPISYSRFHSQLAPGNSPIKQKQRIPTSKFHLKRYFHYIIIVIIPDTLDAQIVRIIRIKMRPSSRFDKKRANSI